MLVSPTPEKGSIQKIVNLLDFLRNKACRALHVFSQNNRIFRSNNSVASHGDFSKTMNDIKTNESSVFQKYFPLLFINTIVSLVRKTSKTLGPWDVQIQAGITAENGAFLIWKFKITAEK